MRGRSQHNTPSSDKSTGSQGSTAELCSVCFTSCLSHYKLSGYQTEQPRSDRGTPPAPANNTFLSCLETGIHSAFKLHFHIETGRALAISVIIIMIIVIRSYFLQHDSKTRFSHFYHHLLITASPLKQLNDFQRNTNML